MNLIPLNKYIAQAGICARRVAVTLIQEGKVMVDGVVVTHPAYKVRPDQTIIYNNKKIEKKADRYIVLNKPNGYVTTRSDEKSRLTVMDLLPPHFRKLLFPIGRLDCATKGVILITNDGSLAYALSHPKFEIEKVYQLTLDRPLEEKDLLAIKRGIRLKDGMIRVDAIEIFGNGRSIQVTIHSGRYRIIRRIFSTLGYRVRTLDRTGFAGIRKKGISVGSWRFLTSEEVRALKDKVAWWYKQNKEARQE